MIRLDGAWDWKRNGCSAVSGTEEQIMPRLLKKLASVLALLSFVVLAGCVSSGSSVSSYGGPSVTSVTAKHKTARADVRAAKRTSLMALMDGEAKFC